MLKKMKTGDLLIYIATAVYTSSLFFPWVYVTFYGNVNGFAHRGYIVLLLFAFPICASLFKKTPRFFSVATSISAVVFLVFYSMEVSQSYMGESVSYPAAGLYIAIGASVVLVAGVILNRRTAKTASLEPYGSAK
ncbi:hypothetical protein FH966_03455 [Lentibacillus cibarius]|uniref:Uncharacterized protein n=1 Tax=Lentibacillus cibarius TaxID=2583219 RepID=A0A549YG39_9BACI|nr:hypothetical protein [Lentibacillus cibarius]TRM10851.1 hypothetical protein FH966_03455 [Lentibacillus cibarius]